MTEERDQPAGAAHGTRGPRETADPGPEVAFLPPVDVAIDVPEFRYAKLSKIVAEQVVPRLLALHEEAMSAAGGGTSTAIPSDADIGQLARLVLGPETPEAMDFILKLKDGGISLDRLHTELLEPTARHLGDLWTDDRIDFVDVTLGVARLQRLVHVFEGLDEVPDYGDKRTVLLACAPGEQHSFGSTIVQKFLRSAGWRVWTCSTPRIEEAADLAAREWLAVVGFSMSSDLHLDELQEAILRVRQASLNPRVGIMVGGSAIVRHPDWVAAVGADGTAANAPAAVILAKKLLAEGLA